MTKSEARNPKQVRMTNCQNAPAEKRPTVDSSRICVWTRERIGGGNLRKIQSRRAMGVMSEHNASAGEPEIFSLRPWRIRGVLREQEQI